MYSSQPHRRDQRRDRSGLHIARSASLTKARPSILCRPQGPFFGELVDFMISAPVVVQVLEGEGAIAKNRDVMGATDPAKAADGTIRKLFAVSGRARARPDSPTPPTRDRDELPPREIVG
jgi:nucleoside diphosphate kinase